jgi:hypothetical protein
LQVFSAGAHEDGRFDRMEQIFHRLIGIYLYKPVKGL